MLCCVAYCEQSVQAICINCHSRVVILAFSGETFSSTLFTPPLFHPHPTSSFFTLPDIPPYFPLSLLITIHYQQDQYVFLHDAILESLRTGLLDSEITVDNLMAHMEDLRREGPKGGTGYQAEFEVSHCCCWIAIV